MADQLDPAYIGAGDGPLPGSDLEWRRWLQVYYPHVCTAPFAPRHVRLWEWFDNLAPGDRPRPRVEVWPRGGAKSSTGELGCVRVGAKLTRRFVLYVSETQEQADKHVQSVSTLFERLGVDRAVNKYGSSKGWRRNQLRTANGFNVSAYGLDVAARGVKLDQYRPDLIVFDDIDSQNDSQRTTEKKINAITTAIIPAGSTDCAILFLQNLIHEEGIVSQLVDGRADFLHNREVPAVEPAVQGLETALEPQPDGSNLYRIVGGTPTWAGQDLRVCEGQINDWGLRAFKREAQHEVQGADGYFFDVSKIQYLDADEIPSDLKLCNANDLAATEGGGDHSAGGLMGRGHGRTFILDAWRAQLGSDRVRAQIQRKAEEYRAQYGRFTLRLPQDPGQAGKDQAQQLARLYAAYSPVIKPVTGDKATRATNFAEELNKGNVVFVKAEWNFALREELRKFQEDERDQADDQVDWLSDAYNELVPPRSFRIF